MDDEGFGELIFYTLPGYIGGLTLGFVLDELGQQVNPFGNWLVRTLSGEGETILESIYSLKKKISGEASSLSTAYGWGKMGGFIFPWIVDLVSRLIGVDMFGVQSFYIPYLYGLSDQIGANISGLFYFIKKHSVLKEGLINYFKNPVMLSSLIIILIAPIALFLARYSGFSPNTQVLVSLETIVVNLCWIPPIVGNYFEKKENNK